MPIGLDHNRVYESRQTTRRLILGTEGIDGSANTARADARPGRAYLGTLCPGHEGLADVAAGEQKRRLDVIPLLLGERIDAAKPRETRQETASAHEEGRGDETDPRSR